jgi:molybdopterin synthase sulfur carrier subunit
MKLIIRPFAIYREIIGERIEVELPSGSSIRDILDMLCEKYKLRSRIFTENGKLQSSVNILLNGRDIRYMKGLSTELRDGDEIAIFPPVAGGYSERRRSNPVFLAL